MTRARRWLASLHDPVVALCLCIAYVGVLLATVGDLGYARDEGFYIRAADEYRAWFEKLFQDPALALQQSTVDKYWKANREHPALIKSLFALSNHFLQRKWELFAEEGTSYRFPGMVLSGVAVGTTHLWGRHAISRTAGLVAALLLAMMPRVFYHAHLDCFDMPVLAMWLVTTFAYWLSLTRGGLFYPVLCGVLYGLLLNTKHNAWLLPPALVAHFLITRGFSGIARDVRSGSTSAPLALFCMATLGPLVFYATWPWIWHDTVKRFSDYVGFHTGHDYYNMEFLGVTYFKPPMPRLYAWVMTAATVPFITLLLFGLGLWRAARFTFWPRIARVSSRLARRIRRSRQESVQTSTAGGGDSRTALSTHTLWLLCLLSSYAPWFSSSTPIFGGTKHWMTAYPFLCLFAGYGFDWVLVRLKSALPPRAARFHAAEVTLAASVLVAPVVMTFQSHPWGLSAYTPLVGGAPGAATLGLNRSFWGYTTGAVTQFLNDDAKRGARVYIHDTANESWNQLVEDRRLRRDLRGTLTLHASDVAVYHHEQHMARVEFQIWVDYGTVSPAHVGTYDGVPVVWVYQRPVSSGDDGNRGKVRSPAPPLETP